MAKNSNYKGNFKSKRKGAAKSKDEYRSKAARNGDAGEGSNLSAYGRSNDIAWYSRNPELLASVSRIPFPYKPGMSYRLNDRVNYVPGVCSIEYYSALGTNDSITDPINIAAKEMYGRVRAKFSGSLDADAPDLMIYTLCLSEIHAALGHYRRIYRLLNHWTSSNYNYPITVLTALGISQNTIDDMLRHKTEIWGQINELTHMTNKWLVPDDMPLFSRKQWLTENVFMDEPIAGAQSYVFRPMAFWKYDPDPDTGSAISSRYITWDGWDTMYNIIKELLDALSEWDDAYTIQGYFERAFEGTTWLRAPLIGAEETQVVMYDSIALSQIENATIISLEDQFTGRNLEVGIEQDPSSNLLKTYARISEIGPDPSRYTWDLAEIPLNLHVEQPTAADTVEATRLRVTLDHYEDNAYWYLDCGTEICTAAKFYFRPGTYVSYSSSVFVDASNSEQSIYNAFEAAAHWTSYAHAPMFNFEYSLSEVTGSTLYANIATIALPSATDYNQMHRVCVFSLFNCFR